MFDRDYADRRDQIVEGGSIIYTRLSSLFYERARASEAVGNLDAAQNERWCGELLMAYSVDEDGVFRLRDLTIVNPNGPWRGAPRACYELYAKVGSDLSEPAEVRAAFLHGLWETRTIWKALNPNLMSFGELVERTIGAHFDAAAACLARLANTERAMSLVEHFRTASRLAQTAKQTALVLPRMQLLRSAIADVMNLDPGWALRLIEIEIELASQRGKRNRDLVTDERLLPLLDLLTSIDATLIADPSRSFLRHHTLKALVAGESLLGNPPSDPEVFRRRALICVDRATRETSAMLQADAWRDAAQQFESGGHAKEGADAKKRSREAAQRAVDTEFVASKVDLKFDRAQYEAQLGTCLEGGTRLILLRLGMNLFAPNLEVEHHPEPDRPKYFMDMIPTMPFVGNRLQESVAPGSDEADTARLNELFALDIGLHNTMFLVPIFNHLATELHLSATELILFLSFSNAMTEDELNLAFVGMRAFLRQDYVSALHLLVPRLENLVRSHLNRAGVDTTAFDFGSMKERTLGMLLSEGRKSGALSIGLHRLLRRVLTDDGGFNLRNKIAHGWATVADCSAANACRIVQMMLFVAALGFDARVSNRPLAHLHA